MRIKSRTLGYAGLVISLFLIIFFSNINDFTVDFTEKYISKDHNIEWITHWYLSFFLILLILLVFSISIFNLLNLWDKLRSTINSIARFEKALEFFRHDTLCSNKNYTSYILIIGPLIGLIYFSYFLMFGIPGQEGIIESTNTPLILFSAVILLLSVPKINKSILTKQEKKWISGIILFLSILLILLFGEEISWGQHVFQWKSTGIFNNGYNFQRETNIHNFLNPLFRFVYPIVGAGSFLIMFFIWFFPNKTSNYVFNLFVPHQSQFFLIFMMACASCLAGKETYEELVAVFFLLYSIRIYMCLSYPTNGKLT